MPPVTAFPPMVTAFESFTPDKSSGSMSLAIVDSVVRGVSKGRENRGRSLKRGGGREGEEERREK